MPLEMDNKIITKMPKFSLCSINKRKGEKVTIFKAILFFLISRNIEH